MSRPWRLRGGRGRPVREIRIHVAGAQRVFYLATRAEAIYVLHAFREEDAEDGREESGHLLVRADLLIQVQKALASRGLKQAAAAKVLRVTQPRVSDLLRGRIDLFSTDTLIDMLARLGVGIRLVIKTPRSKKVA